MRTGKIVLPVFSRVLNDATVQCCIFQGPEVFVASPTV